MTKTMQQSAYVLALGVLLTGCGSDSSSSRSSATTTPGATGTQTEVTLTAGLEALTPETNDSVSSTVDLQRLNVTRVDSVYDLSSPADTPFAFSVFARERGNAGAVRISLAHAADGGAAPTGDVTSIVEAGIVPSGSGAQTNGDWVDLAGDGFARLTVKGRITQAQVLVIQTETSAGVRTAIVRVQIGAPSAINVETATESPCPTVTAQKTLYSSDSFKFGLPTVAISGDRTSVVVYEGDDNDPHGQARYEMRLQHDTTTGVVTGGGSSETSPDSGNWRDHEIAALFNVLALVHSGDSDATIALSFDRGATFAQTHTLASGSSLLRQRLVQIAIAADYTLAVTYWRAGGDYHGELMLIEGRPSSFDAGGSPTAYAFDPPVLVHDAAADVTPLVMGIKYSDGGDLVVGYGYSKQVPGSAGAMFASVTSFRCAVRLFGATAWDDTLVDDELIESFDPSVGLLGQGTALQIFYGYESRDGVKLKVSGDAGASWSAATLIGDTGAFQPSVQVRTQGGLTRLDVLFLEHRDMGSELRVQHWDHYDGSAPGAEFTVAESSSVPVPGGQGELEVTSVAWLGYDATLDGDDVVVVYDEHTYDTMFFCGGPPLGLPVMMSTSPAAGAAFNPATPPPLAPGMTQTLPAPNPDDSHQLKCVRMD
jgi:hypothetical protein